MADIGGGSLSFTSQLDNSQLNAAVAETLRRVQGMSDAIAASGGIMDSTTQEIVESIGIQQRVIQELELTINQLNEDIRAVEPGDVQNALMEQASAARQELDAERQGLAELESQLRAVQQANGVTAVSFSQIRSALTQIGDACAVHEHALAQLESEYEQLGVKMGKAFAEGRDDEYRAIRSRREAIMGEIRVREQLLKELREQSTALDENAAATEAANQKTQAAAQKQVSFQTEIRKSRNELKQMAADGLQGTAEYAAVQQRLVELTKASNAVNKQMKALASPTAQFQGIISGLSGVSGAFAAAQGAIGLFGDANEDLQKIMLKVQSLMSITMGLQQVSTTLNKNSAFQQTTLNTLKAWWNNLLGISSAKQAEETAATVTNTTAKVANTTATKTGTVAQVANTTATTAQTAAATAGTVANIGLAGAFRMVGAAIKSIPVFGWILAGISALIAILSSFTDEVKEAKVEANDFFNKLSENAYKPIGSIEMLSQKWSELGNNLEAKQQFIVDNREKFDDLGISIDNVREAENALVANKEAFIEAQIAKAKALALVEETSEKVKKALELEAQIEALPDTVVGEKTFGEGSTSVTQYTQIKNLGKEAKKRELEALKKEIKDGFSKAAEEEARGWKVLDDARIKANRNRNGSGNGGNSGNGGATKDPYLEQLAKYKSAYEEYYKWKNSADKGAREAADVEFKSLLEEGSSYMDYLQKQRDAILNIDESKRTNQQKKQLSQLTSAIAEETKETVMQAFNDALSKELDEANTVVQILDVIKQKRAELSNDNSDLDNAKKDTLDEAENSAKKQAEAETKQLLEEYAGYLQRKKKLEEDFNNDIELLRRKRAKAESDEEIAAIDAAILNRTKQYNQDKQSSGDEDYDALLEKHRNFEEQRAAIDAKYEDDIATARLHKNKELEEQLIKDREKEKLDVSLEELKVAPEYAEAFTDISNVSTETLNALVEKFNECKIAAAGALNPDELEAYGEKLRSIVEELQSRDPFTAIKEGYAELKSAQQDLKKAQNELAEIRKNGGEGTKEETDAINKVNKAKDKETKANNKVKKSQKVVYDSVKKLTGEISELGDAIGGQAGEIISLIGDIGTFVVTAMEGVKTASETSSTAIQTVEKASVILAIVSAAYQIAMKIFSLFAGDDGTAAYERAADVYQDYIDILDDVIEKQEELIASMDGTNAKNSYNYALSLLDKATDAARELGKQYLNAGASIKSHSNGINQLKNISTEAWAEWAAFVEKTGVDYDLASGRMTGLFDLTAEQIAELRETAPLFYASLASETQEYLDAIADSRDTAEELKDAFNEALTGIDYDSFESDFVDMLSDVGSSTEDFVDNFQEYMRKALISNMFKSQFKSQLEKYYQMWADALDPDGDGGSDITEAEAEALNTLRDSIITGATEAADKINEQFDVSDEEEDALTGAVKGVTEDTADIIAGQMNAIRINQLESADILRQQLQTLNAIAANTEYNRYLARIERVITILENAYQNDSLRAQGLS